MVCSLRDELCCRSHFLLLFWLLQNISIWIAGNPLLISVLACSWFACTDVIFSCCYTLAYVFSFPVGFQLVFQNIFSLPLARVNKPSSKSLAFCACSWLYESNDSFYCFRSLLFFFYWFSSAPGETCSFCNRVFLLSFRAQRSVLALPLRRKWRAWVLT